MPLFRAFTSAALVAMSLALGVPGLVAAHDLEPVSGSPDATVLVDAGGAHPRQLRVTAGQIVEWRNTDGERHRVRSRSGPAEFDSGNLETGERYRIRFTAIGTYPYVDERNEDATAWHGRIVVVAAGAQSDGATDGSTDPGTAGQADPGTSAASSATVVLEDDFVDPASVRIEVGGTVTFRNEGEDEHSATSTDGGPIDSGVLSGGTSHATTFADAGTFAFMCIFHSEMRGTVTVVAPTGADGAVPGSPDPTPTATPAPTATVDPAPPASGAPSQVDVQAADIEFRAPDVTIAVGGQVTWTNLGQAPHTVTSADGSFDSGILEPGATFDQRFDSEGTFDYLCEVHPGMAGTVEVVAATAGGTTGASVNGAASVGAVEPSSLPAPTSAATTSLAPTSAADDGALTDLAGLVLAVTAIGVAVALFAKVIGGTVRPAPGYRPE